MKWQPIETAPKNVRILLWYPVSIFTGINIVAGKWDTDKWAVKPRPYWSNDLEQLRGVRSTRENQPTHWMLLPEPLDDHD